MSHTNAPVKDLFNDHPKGTVFQFLIVLIVLFVTEDPRLKMDHPNDTDVILKKFG